MTSSPPRSRLRLHEVTVVAVEPVAADGSAVAVTCRVPDELRDVFAFAPGQHVTVRTTIGDTEIRRSYSLCSTPAELARHGLMRIGVRMVTGGAFSAYANSLLAVGDVLEVLPPVGNFVTALDPERRRRYAAIVAGSGITPVLSLVSTTLATEQDSTFTVLYGNRRVDSMMFIEELADLKNRHPRRLNLVHVFSREQPQLGLAGGRLTPATLASIFTGILEPATVREWFLCGPLDMVRDAQRTLAEHGVDDSAVHAELFHADEGAAPGPVIAAPVGPQSGGQAHDLTVLADGRTSTVRMRSEQRILDAVLSVRPELPYSCQTGVCATCRARVVDGEVRMARNWALTAEEMAAGYVLTCQSTPTTDRVTVDFDVV